MGRLPRLGKRELICLLLFTCNYVVSVRRGFLFLWVLGMGCVILLWNSLSLPYNYFASKPNFAHPEIRFCIVALIVSLSSRIKIRYNVIVCFIPDKNRIVFMILPLSLPFVWKKKTHNFLKSYENFRVV